MIRIIDSSEASAEPPATAAATDRIFSAGGTLQAGLGLEYRDGQRQLALAIADACDSDTPLIAEAGTGVGKSLAYIIPCLLKALSAGRQLVISTHTIALQEQILSKDLPLVRRIFAADPATSGRTKFKVAMLIGRGNYLCGSRLRQIERQTGDLLLQAQEAELRRISEWAKVTEKGRRDELNPPPPADLWEMVNADSSVCNRKHCNPDDCPYQRAKSELRQANVIVVNHSLLFSLLSAGAGVQGGPTPGVLFPKDIVVLDEAHTVHGVATEHFGHRVSSYGLNRLLNYIYNPKRDKGLISKLCLPHDKSVISDAIDSARDFFSEIHYRFLSENEVARLTEPDWADAAVLTALERVANTLSTIANRTPDERINDELLDQRDRVLSHRNAIAECLKLDADDTVYWLERGGRRTPIIALRSAPLDISELLKRQLFERRVPVILTSATMSTGDSMEGIRRQLGAGSVRAEVFSSPFDYTTAMRIRVAADAPEITSEGKLDSHYLADNIAFFAASVSGGTLVLFTSHRELNNTRRLLADQPSIDGRPVFCQGDGRSRQQLVAEFAACGNGILMGTDSFWTGIDVPGLALSQVIITRLPFANPSHPVTQARAEYIRRSHRSPFAEMTLPDAVLQFRQGVGRLIRTQSDCGWVTILDSRVLTKQYGRRFLDALPHANIVRFTRENRQQLFAQPWP